MVPFVADHPLFHPNEEIRQAAESGTIPPLSCLSGESIRYLRSEIPVVVFRLKRNQYEEWKSLIHDRPASRLTSDHRIDIAEDSKLRTQWAAGDGTVYTAILKSQEDPFHYTTDSLIYENNQWAGNPASVLDYESGQLQLADFALINKQEIMRSCIVSAMSDFELHRQTLQAFQDYMSRSPGEELPKRFMRKQVIRLMLSARPSQGFLALDSAGLLQEVFPELHKTKGLSQNRHHRYDIFYHLLYACDHAKPQLHLRLAALLHDIGKADTRRVRKNGEATFYNHEVVGARITEKIMKRFGFDPSLGKRVRFLVRNHMFHYTGEWTDKAVRRFMSRVSKSELNDLIELRLADRKGSGKKSQLPAPIIELMERMNEMESKEKELKIKDLAIGGKELMELGMPPGKPMGDLLKTLLHQVKSENLENTKEALILRAKELHQTSLIAH